MTEQSSVSDVIAKTVDPLFAKKPYPEWAKMPADYDFNTKGRSKKTKERIGASLTTTTF
jgi:hypothetical protein